MTTSSPRLAPAGPSDQALRLVTLLAAVAALGGALLFTDLALQAFRGLGKTYFVIAALMALCFPALPIAWLRRGAVRRGWPIFVAGAGLGLVVLGAMAWLAAFGLLFIHPEAAFTQHLTPGGSLLMAIGMVTFGVSVLASRRLAGAGVFTPLAVGLYFPLQLIIQLTFFLQGKDGAPGPNGLFLGSWGLVWILSAWCVAHARNRDAGSGTAA